MVTRRVARHRSRTGVVRSRALAALLPGGGFAVGLGAHRALFGSGIERWAFAAVGAAGLATVVVVLVGVRRAGPGRHAEPR